MTDEFENEVDDADADVVEDDTQVEEVEEAGAPEADPEPEEGAEPESEDGEEEPEAVEEAAEAEPEESGHFRCTARHQPPRYAFADSADAAADTYKQSLGVRGNFDAKCGRVDEVPHGEILIGVDFNGDTFLHDPVGCNQ